MERQISTKPNLHFENKLPNLDVINLLILIYYITGLAFIIRRMFLTIMVNHYGQKHPSDIKCKTRNII